MTILRKRYARPDATGCRKDYRYSAQKWCEKGGFFGSVVRGEMTDESDVDLLVEFEKRTSLMDLSGLKIELKEALNRRVDILTYRSLHPLLKERILAEQAQIL